MPVMSSKFRPPAAPKNSHFLSQCHFVARQPSVRRQQTPPRDRQRVREERGELVMNSTAIALAISRCPFAYLSGCLMAAALLAGQTVLPASADSINDGKTAFSQCSACHRITGTEDSGPHLNGVLGRRAGSVPSFNYSPAMKNADIVWDLQRLDRFLANPQQEVPGTRMPFSGLPDVRKRAAIIAYLATLK